MAIMDTGLTRLEMELSTAFTNFVRVTAQVDPDKRYQPGVSGDWSPKDVISHLIGWDESLQKFIADPDGFDPSPLYDLNAFNAKSVSERHYQSWAETMDELQRSYKDLLQAIRGVTVEMRIYDRVRGWLQGRREDYEFHTSQMEEWIMQN